MGTQSLTAEKNRRCVHPNGRPGTAENPLLRYRLNVIAAEVADVVQSVGGWLFDQSMAGWEVNVLLPDRHDPRPLQILGARTVELYFPLSSIAGGEEPAAGLAVASHLLGSDVCIDREVHDALRSGDVEVALWGDGGLVGEVDAVQYRLSGAARIFKAHALAAAGLTDVPVVPFETLFRSGYRHVDSHLIPIS